jgi:3-oxoacyl-[acyl-carrier-protein] synthase III
MIRSRIIGTGCALPDRVVTNEELADLMDTSDEWIRTRTGIQERRWIREGETGAGLARQASDQALAMAGVSAGELDAIVFATCTPDHFIPGNGVLLQHLLGVPGIPALDIRMACSGFVYALSVADAWIRSGEFRRILVVGAEIQSTGLDISTEGRNTAVIFADGAGAVVLAPSEAPDRGILAFDLKSDGAHAEVLWVDTPGSMYNPRISPSHLAQGRQFVSMDGKEVFRHAVTRMPESVRAVLAKVQLSPGDISLLLPHQANLRISEMVQRNLELRDDQVYNNIQHYGNTTAATIPIMLDQTLREERIRPGDLVVMTAFGAGFAWGSAAVRW